MQSQANKQFPLLAQMLVICTIGLLLGFASTKLQPYLLLTLGLGIVYIGIVWLWPEYAILSILLLTSTIIDENSLPSVPIGIGHLIVSDFLLFIPLGIMLIRIWVEPGFGFVHTPLDFPLLAFYGIAVLSTILAISQGTITFNQSLGELRTVNLYLIFFLVTNFIRTRKQLYILLNGILILTIFVALMMVAQYALGDITKILPGRVETLFTAGTTDQGVTRILPPGQSLILVILILLPVLLIFDKDASKSLFRLFQLFIVGLAVLLTFNRSFWVAMMFSLFLVVILVSMRDKVRYLNLAFLSIGIIAAVTILAVAAAGKQAQSLIDGAVIRFSTLLNPNTLNESSLRYRDVEFQYAVPQILDHPAIGLGLGSHYRPWDRRIDFGPIDWDKLAYIHNGHLWVILKTGVLGYVFFAWFLLLFIKRSLQHWSQIQSPFLRAIMLSFAVTIIGILPATIVNPIFAQAYWASIIGIMLGTSEIIIRLNKAASDHNFSNSTRIS